MTKYLLDKINTDTLAKLDKKIKLQPLTYDIKI